jgi:hypothetical protein
MTYKNKKKWMRRCSCILLADERKIIQGFTELQGLV